MVALLLLLLLPCLCWTGQDGQTDRQTDGPTDRTPLPHGCASSIDRSHARMLATSRADIGSGSGGGERRRGGEHLPNRPALARTLARMLATFSS